MAHHPLNRGQREHFETYHKGYLDELRDWLKDPLFTELFSEDRIAELVRFTTFLRATAVTLDEDMDRQMDLEATAAWFRAQIEEAYAREDIQLRKKMGTLRLRARDTSKPEWVADAVVDADPEVERLRDRLVTYQRLQTFITQLSFALQHRAKLLDGMARRRP